MQADISGRPALSLAQLMKFVVFCAVACAIVVPILGAWRSHGGIRTGDFVDIALWVAIFVPLAWIALSLVLVRRGAWKDGLILALLLCPVTASLWVAFLVLFTYAIPSRSDPLVAPKDRADVHFLIMNLVIILVLSCADLFLLLSLWARRKALIDPTCGGDG